MGFDFDTPVERRGTSCIKYDFAVERGYPADVLPLWVADMDFPVPECVTKALTDRVQHGIFGYSDTKDGYFEAVQSWFARRHGLTVEKEWLIKTPGVVFALAQAVRALTEPGDGVVIQTPVYAPFHMVVRNNGRKLLENPLIYRDGRYTVDFENLEAQLKSARLLILCSPHNPVCRVWTKDELRQVGLLCRKYDVTVVSDEIHCDFAFPEHPHTPFLSACPEMAERTVMCTAPSKTFNLAGLQVSNLFVPGQAIREKLKAELERIGYSQLNCLGTVACQAAYEGGEAWLDACKAYMRENLDFVRQYLAENLPQVKLVEPEGTYFAWLDCTGLGLTEEELNRAIVQRGKLWLDAGGIFGQEAALFQRVVLACPRTTLARAMAQFCGAFACREEV